MKKTTVFCHVTQKEYNQIILENSEDVLMYQLADFDSQTSLAGQMWCDMANSNTSPTKFLTHNSQSYGNSNQLVSYMILMGFYDNVESNMKTLANIISDTHKSKYNRMNQFIKQNNIIIVNQKGGYHYLKSIDDVETPIDNCNLYEMKQFVMNGKFNSPIITGKILILENSQNVSYEFNKKIRETFGENISVINNLKMQPDVKKLITQAFNNGVEVIAFQSTGMDINQIESMKKLIEGITEKMKRSIMVYADVDKELRHLYQSQSDQVNVVFS